MADVTTSSGASSKHGKPRSKKQPLRVDLTPMVDLAFLLISFFMLTTILTEERFMPLDKRISDDSTAISECRVLNILIDSFDRVYTYEGFQLGNLQKTSFASDGVRQVIMTKTEHVKHGCGRDKEGNPYPLVCLVKLFPGARYQNLIDIMDELALTKTDYYSMPEPDMLEREAVRAKERLLLAENR